MILIEDYMLLSQAERQKHLRLDEPCVERGGAKIYTEGKQLSSACKILLAHIFNTTMPIGMKIFVCHACHNHKCSNPHHLYWGTNSENMKDARKSGSLKTIHEYTTAKYGREKTLEMYRSQSIYR
jgi:hypothetical protein